MSFMCSVKGIEDESLRPVGILIIASGVNDLKHKYSRIPGQTRDDLLWSLDRLKETSSEDKQDKWTRLLYLLPPNFDSALFPRIIPGIQSLECKSNGRS